MKPYFSTAKRRAALLAELERWRGTPFMGHVAMPGVGVDCVRFAAAALAGAGAIAPLDFPRYPLNGGDPEIREMLCGRIESAGLTALPDGAPPALGDVLVFSTGSFQHVGLMGEGGNFWHVLRGQKTGESLLADSTFSTRLFRVYRLFKAPRQPMPEPSGSPAIPSA
jgi:cell wall-associated NlpC family hydrolase